MGGWVELFAGCWWMFLIFIFIMIVACMFAMRRCSCMSGWNHPGEKQRRYCDDPAEEILNKRYAHGEIEREEYEEKRAGITHEEEVPKR